MEKNPARTETRKLLEVEAVDDAERVMRLRSGGVAVVPAVDPLDGDAARAKCRDQTKIVEVPPRDRAGRIGSDEEAALQRTVSQSKRTSLPMPMSDRLIDCWLRPTMASAGVGTGWTRRAMRIVMAMKRMASDRLPGATATGSLRPSTPTSRLINSP